MAPDLFADAPAAPQPADHRCLGCGQHHADAATVTLIGGATVSTYSEAWRLECEARAILNLPGQVKRQSALDNIQKHRGKKSADELRACMLAIWKARQAEKITA